MLVDRVIKDRHGLKDSNFQLKHFIDALKEKLVCVPWTRALSSVAKGLKLLKIKHRTSYNWLNCKASWTSSLAEYLLLNWGHSGKGWDVVGWDGDILEDSDEAGGMQPQGSDVFWTTGTGLPTLSGFGLPTPVVQAIPPLRGLALHCPKKL